MFTFSSVWPESPSTPCIILLPDDRSYASRALVYGRLFHFKTDPSHNIVVVYMIEEDEN